MKSISMRILTGLILASILLSNNVFAKSKAKHYIPSKIRHGHDFKKIRAGAEYKPGELLIRFRPGAKNTPRSSAHKSQVVRSLGNSKIKRNFRRIHDASLIELPPGLKVKDALAIFNDHPDILYAEPNYKIYLNSTFPSDPFISDDVDDPDNLLWGMHNIGQTGGMADADIDAPEAWDLHTDANDIIVAVLDTGIDYNHPDLAANLWDPNDSVSYGYDFYNDDSDPIDDNGHGTHVAGTIGAAGNNSVGVAGVCWKVKIMSLKLFSSTGYGHPASWVADAVEAIEYAVDNGATVLNNSWVGPFSQPIKDAIVYTQDAGAIFVVAAGNDYSSQARYPARYDCENIISVLATDHDDLKADFSIRNAVSVALGAPGVDIFSTRPTYSISGLPLDYGMESGTSMATPHVAGACALVWSYHPGWTWQEVKEAILGGVDIKSDLTGKCVTGGRLNLYNSMVYKPSPISLTKVDDISDDPNNPGLIEYNDEITYTITYTYPAYYPGNPNDPNDPPTGDPDAVPLHNITITDFLPDEVSFVSAEPNDLGQYFLFDMDGNLHYWLWNVGTVSPGDSNSVTITVKADGELPPLGTITNLVIIENDDSRAIGPENTPVACVGGEVIYVDQSAGGNGSGSSWNNAYPNLGAALDRASLGCGSEIWVAGGTYISGESFSVVDGVSLYGGFAGTETQRNQRNFLAYSSVLIANGNTVSITDANDVIIDGFTINSEDNSGIYTEGASVKITNCAVIDSDDYGIKAKDSTLDISYCSVSGNGSDGIYLENCDPNITWLRVEENASDGIYLKSNSSLQLANCIIRLNEDHGIYAYSLSGLSFIKNSWVHHNGTDGSGYGIYLHFSTVSLDMDIRNNTIVYNDDYGIYQSSSSGTVDVFNNILWHNNSGSGQTSGSFDSKFNNCIQGLSPLLDGNIADDPDFAYADETLYNFHLSSDSLCIGAGTDPNDAFGSEVDIDNESRVVDTIDIGADEYVTDEGCDGVWNAVDFNADGIANYIDFAPFAAVFLVDINTGPNLSIYDLYSDSSDIIDVYDLDVFAGNWLWEACWRDSPFYQFYNSSDVSIPLSSYSSMFASAPPAPAPVEYEPTLLEQALQLIDVLGWLEGVMEDPEVQEQVDEASLLNVIESIEESLLDLQQQYREQQE